MKRDLADWLNGLGVPDDESEPELIISHAALESPDLNLDSNPDVDINLNSDIKTETEDAEDMLLSKNLPREDVKNSNSNSDRKFLTEKDELQNLADALLLDDDDNSDIQPEAYNYSLEDLQQLESYVEQLENLLDEQEGVLREEIKNNISNVNNINSVNNDDADKLDIDKNVKVDNSEGENNKSDEINNDVNNIDSNFNNFDGIDEIDDVDLDALNMVFNGGSGNDNSDNVNKNAIVVKERNGEFTQKLHSALHNRKLLAFEKSAHEKQFKAKQKRRRFKSALLCAIILALAFAALCGTLLYFKNKQNKQIEPVNNFANFDDKGNNIIINSIDSVNNVDVVDSVDKSIDKIVNDIVSIDSYSEDKIENKNDNVNNLKLDILDVKDNDIKDDIKIKSGDAQEQELEENIVIEKSEDVNINVNMNIKNDLNNKKIMTYDEYIQAGSRALNKKLWDDAILNFYKALQIQSGDIKPMIGLAGAYYGKGMFFDALRIINEARSKFPLDTTVEFMRRTLRRAR